MAKYYFSASTLGLYISSIHKTLPPDAKEITENRYMEVVGKVLSADASGLPVIILPAGKTQDEINAEAWHELQSSAKSELGKSDITVLRCVENGIPVPETWATYRQGLRAIISAPSGDASQGLPIKPAYPAGT
jgi:hypothetical protein